MSLTAGEATVQFDERLTSPDQLKAAVKGAGYGVRAGSPAHGHHSRGGCCGKLVPDDTEERTRT